MNSYEKEEISKLPPQYRPLGAWGYFGYSILFSIPIVGFIFLIVFACSGSNINRRSYARSYFCAFIIVAIAAVLLFVLSGSAIMEILQEYKAMLPQ